MGKRILYQIQNGKGSTIATLVSNSAHPTQIPEEIFKIGVRHTVGPTSLLEFLMVARYKPEKGQLLIDDRIFWVLADDAAFELPSEKLIVARYDSTWSVSELEFPYSL